MRYYMAPMEGVTNEVYRNAYHKYFYPMDKYFTPFISAKPNKRLSFKEIREVSPETNQGLNVIPQILTNNADDFIQTAEILKEYGHQEINLNLGCPSGTVTAKGKGSGFLAEPEKLDRFLDTIFSKSDMRISVKTRIGTDYEDDWDQLLSIYNKYPMEELIIHPRIQKDFYKYPTRPEAFRKAQKVAKMPLCYNGNLFDTGDYQAIRDKFPETYCFMFGRGLIMNPGLVGEIATGRKMDKKVLRSFHDELYHEYRELLCGDRNVLFRMKELWNYMILSFGGHEKYAKKIKKVQKCSEYETIISCLFSELDLTV